MAVAEVVAPFTQSGAPVTPPADTPQRPDNVPEKFWDAEKGVVRTEDLLKSYTELEKSRGAAPQADDPPAADPSADAAPDKTDADAQAEAAADAAGVSMTALEAEFTESGTLSDDSYAKLAKAGFDKGVVDEFIAYRKESGERAQQAYYELVGGEQALASMQTWAASNYTPEQAEAFNEAVNSRSKARIEVALKALKADYTAANPSRPTFLKPDASSSSSGGGAYESMAQLMADQRDPRYFSDPAFRDQVVAKLKRSNLS